VNVVSLFIMLGKWIAKSTMRTGIWWTTRNSSAAYFIGGWLAGVALETGTLAACDFPA
jgi:hypothetical protein